MSKFVKITLPVIMLLLAAGQASATYSAYWAVDWAPGIRGITFKLANLDPGDPNKNYSAGISGATGREAATAGGITTAGQYAEFVPVFCVDLTRFAASNFGGAFAVDVNTGADGTSGWSTPSGDGDELRSQAGLGRAAELAGYYGSTWANVGSVLQGVDATDSNNRAIALNVAIWQAAYGSNFTYVGGLTAPQTAYFNTYIAHYNQGATTGSYKWWDSKVADAPSTNQDFLSGTIPEPSSLLLLGSFLAGGAALPRLRRKKRSA